MDLNIYNAAPRLRFAASPETRVAATHPTGTAIGKRYLLLKHIYV